MLYLFFGVYIVFIYAKRIQLESHQNITKSPPTFILGGYTWSWFDIVCIAIGIAACLLLPWTYLAPAFIICIAFSQLSPEGVKHNVFALFLGLIAASFLPWWLHNDKNRLALSLWQSLTFFSITLFIYWALTEKKLHILPYKYLFKFLFYGLFFCAVLLLSFTPGIGLVTTNFVQWHHWSAYIGPAELIYHGAIPFNDIPLQYGFGPTMIIAAACGGSCWNALYWASGTGTVLISLALAYLAIKIYQPKNIIQLVTILLIVFLCSIFYTAYPANLLSVLATPSTSGLRFLPGVLMLCLIIDQISKNSIGRSHAKISIGIFDATNLPMHFLWIASFVWAPEAAIQTSVLWIPYCAWNRLSLLNGLPLIIEAIKVGLQFLISFILALLCFNVIFLFFYGEWPIMSSYFTYILNPPGPMPINSNGSIWFAIMCAILWFSWSKSDQDQISVCGPNSMLRIIKSMWVLVLLCFANFTYYLGRSHDNNILNLLPYFSILLMGISRWSENGKIKIISTIMLSSIVGWSALFGFSHYGLAFKSHVLLDKSPSTLIASFNRKLDSSGRYLQAKTKLEIQKTADARNALQYLHQNSPDAVEIFDHYLLIDSEQIAPPWNALHGPVNFGYIPSALRRHYLQNIANRFQRSGWVMYDKDFEMKDYLREYDAVYQRTRELDFGTYYAIHYSPRP